MCESFFFIKVAAPKPADLLKKKFWHRCFPFVFLLFDFDKLCCFQGTPEYLFNSYYEWVIA